MDQQLHHIIIVKHVDELRIIVKNLKKKPFIDRLYTAPVVYKLRQRMLDNGR